MQSHTSGWIMHLSESLQLCIGKFRRNCQAITSLSTKRRRIRLSWLWEGCMRDRKSSFSENFRKNSRDDVTFSLLSSHISQNIAISLIFLIYFSHTAFSSKTWLFQVIFSQCKRQLLSFQPTQPSSLLVLVCVSLLFALSKWACSENCFLRRCFDTKSYKLQISTF